MLSQRESPTFHSSQVLRSNPTAKLFLLKEGKGTRTQLPLLALLSSLESVREFLAPPNTPQPRYRKFIHLSVMDLPEIPKSLSSAPTQLRAGIFLHFISFQTRIQHRCGDTAKDFPQKRFPDSTSSISSTRNIQFWKKKPKFSISEQLGRGDGTRTTHVPVEAITTWELGAKGSAGKNFPHRNILLPLQRLPSNGSSLLKDYKLLPELRERGLIPPRKPEPGVPASGAHKGTAGI